MKYRWCYIDENKKSHYGDWITDYAVAEDKYLEAAEKYFNPPYTRVQFHSLDDDGVTRIEMEAESRESYINGGDPVLS